MRVEQHGVEVVLCVTRVMRSSERYGFDLHVDADSSQLLLNGERQPLEERLPLRKCR